VVATASAGTARSAVAARRRPPRRPAQGTPLERLTVLYDPDCRLCAFISNWLPRQRQLVPLDLVPVGSDRARRLFPELDHAATAREVTVVGDGGQVYRGDSAWLVCLWALSEFRPLSHTFALPRNRKMARAAVVTAAKFREADACRRSPASARPGPAPVPPIPPAPTVPWVYAKEDGWTYWEDGGWTRNDGASR
jgi:predicted DCC family thiol-disulfide oxidoreductase YuxK